MARKLNISDRDLLIALFNAVTALAEHITGKTMVIHIQPKNDNLISVGTTPLSVSFLETQEWRVLFPFFAVLA